MSGLVVADLLRMLQIVWLDLLLSGDNAVVIALASRNLPSDDRRRTIWLGALAAIVLRLLFALTLLQLLRLPGLHLVGGALLLWIGVSLTVQQTNDEQVAAGRSVWAAVRLIAFADILMSLDNVLAITAAAHGDGWLIVFGLLVSLPLVMFGAGAFLLLLRRAPWLLWASAALVGASAGQMAAEDSAIAARLENLSRHSALWSALVGGALVVALAAVRGWRARRRAASH